MVYFGYFLHRQKDTNSRSILLCEIGSKKARICGTFYHLRKKLTACDGLFMLKDKPVGVALLLFPTTVNDARDSLRHIFYVIIFSTI